VSSDGPVSKTVEAFEHVGRSFATDGADRNPLQMGCCTLRLALIQPVLLMISQLSTPVVPPIRLIESLGS
jgi:hypothetical protein